jgi:NADPH:quinone reductase-like Zn-dependent oxidoreductase
MEGFHMRAIVIQQYGGPDALTLEERLDPTPGAEQVLIEVKAFGLNHAEVYLRSGAWGDVAEITGIECVGVVREDPCGRFKRGAQVFAIVGGLGRNLNGSYAELVVAPSSNVVAIESDLSWEALAAIPESYATAWTALVGILRLKEGQTTLIRGATSALGQAAIDIARNLGARVIATSRNAERAALLRDLGADEVLLDTPDLSRRIRESHPVGIDSALEIVGNTTVLDSLAALRRGGGVCQVGFLGGGGPLCLEPVFQIPGGRNLTAFASALVTGSAEFPISEIPFQAIVDRVASGAYKAKPTRVFEFSQIQEAHRVLEAGTQLGKMVVRVGAN